MYHHAWPFVKVIGGRGLSRKWGFRWFWKFQIQSFRNFLRNRKSLLCCHTVTRQSWHLRALLPENVWKNPGKWAKIQTFLSQKCFHFGSRSLLKPLFWYSGPISWVIQTLFGIFRDFEFLTYFRCRESQKIDFFRKNVNFLTFRAPKRGKKIKISEIPK